MLKKTEDWSKEELFDFGMWHILPTNQFEEYASLNGYDRSEWVRKYWKQRDPTPTTEKNESKIEFQSRVNYARAHFSELWNYRHFSYLKDQHRRKNWPRAPWDARGEVYIKYGEPDSRTVHGYHQEEWIYYRYNVDFIIDQYKTNIYGNAIVPGEMSQYTYRDMIGHVDANFIYHQEFKYEHDYKAKPMKKAKCSIESDPLSAEHNVTIHYSVPTKELKLMKIDNHYFIKVLERYVVFDEDMQEVCRHETVKELKEKDKKSFKKRKHIEETFVLTLEPGYYKIALRIEDQHSNQLGIFLENCTVNK